MRIGDSRLSSDMTCESDEAEGNRREQWLLNWWPGVNIGTLFPFFESTLPRYRLCSRLLLLKLWLFDA